MCRKRNILYRKYVKNPTDYRKLTYIEYRNTVTSAIRHYRANLLQISYFVKSE